MVGVVTVILHRLMQFISSPVLLLYNCWIEVNVLHDAFYITNIKFNKIKNDRVLGDSLLGLTSSSKFLLRCHCQCTVVCSSRVGRGSHLKLLPLSEAMIG